VRSTEVAAQPWRNGGGITRELLTWPPGPDWRWRLSLADITSDGLFSTFAGVQRWCVVLEGDGVELTIDGQPIRQTQGDPPLHFSGDAHTDCRLLAGATRDLNLMLRGAGGGMFEVRPGLDWSPATPSCGLFSASAGRCNADGLDHEVPAMSLLWFDQAPGTLRFDPDRPGPAGWWLRPSTGDDKP
jgi:hypothetical protein